MKRGGFAGLFAVVACAAFAAGVGWRLCESGGNGVRAAARADAGQAAKVPVLVELFTSEGCSSCPPADALLGKLDREQPLRNAKIIVLSEHVDYWNNGGWQDRFSSASLTRRQEEYSDLFKLNDVYTPQMVVNGAAQMNGTDEKAIAAALEKAAASHPIPLQITSVQVRGQDVTFTLRKDMSAIPGYVNMYVALVDPEDTTKVGGGENGGRTLQHAGVVRKLELAGSAWRTQDLGKMPFVIEAPQGTNPEGMRLVVFVQNKKVGPVQGADACLIARAKTSDGPVASCPDAGD